MTDFHDFDYCQFRFFVKHHLDRKYEIEAGNESLALGILLDQAIKIFHESKAYGKPVDYLPNLIKAAENFVRAKVAKQSTPSFYSAIVPFLTPELISKATTIFQNYYRVLEGQIKQSIAPVNFCEWIIGDLDLPGSAFKLWGGPDTLELGEDGIPEIVDYKSRENIERGKDGMDMDLMPKLYTLLCAKQLLGKGYTKARFIVRFWQDPKEASFYEEFDLENIASIEGLFKQKIDRITSTTEVSLCEKNFCSACKSDKRDEYIAELATKFGLTPLTAGPIAIVAKDDELAWLND